MPTESTSDYQREWICLQNQYDSYEKYSLIIKLVSVLLCSSLLFHSVLNFTVALLCTVLWLLDSVWKTFQSRINVRLLEIESALANDIQNGAFQYNSRWLQNRPSTIRLLREYLFNGLSPTVMGPHAIIIVTAIFTAVKL